MINRRLFSQVKNVKSIKHPWSSFYRPLQLTSPFTRSFGAPTGIALIGTPITAWYISQARDDSDKEPPLTIAYPQDAIEISSLRVFLRIFYLGLLITPAMVLFPFWILMEYILKSDALRVFMVRILCWTLENMGPTFIKVFYNFNC